MAALPSGPDSPHIPHMPKPRSPSRPTRAKASRPDAQPLDAHLAALLNPSLNEKRGGFGEGPQAGFDSGGVTSLDPALAPLLGRRNGGADIALPTDEVRRVKPKRDEIVGAHATIESLKDLLERGDPNIDPAAAWTPHRPARPEKSEGGVRFRLVSEYEPKGDQPTAIAELVAGVNARERDQVLLGVTGSGKTFTAAQVIEKTNRPALILAPNKTLAAQLYGEFKSFFPENAVEYFVSYYDYYQPEAYVPRTDTYIEKESSINEQIDRMRHSATRALLERDDVIIVASVSSKRIASAACFIVGPGVT